MIIRAIRGLNNTLIIRGPDLQQNKLLALDQPGELVFIGPADEDAAAGVLGPRTRVEPDARPQCGHKPLSLSPFPLKGQGRSHCLMPF